MYISKKTIVGKNGGSMKIVVLAADDQEMQIQVEKEYDDFFFDLSVEEAMALRDSLTEFIGD